jgi:DNA-binding transcriptional LysR family regulator
MRHVAEDLRKAERGRIRIAATPAFGIDVLPGAIAGFRQRNRDVFFSVETLHHGEICSALLESRVDLGLLFDPGMVPGISGDVLGTGRMYVLTPPGIDFGGREALRIEDLAGHPFISLDRRGPLGRLLHKRLQSAQVDLDTVAYAETYHVAKSMVAHGAGVTIADGITARSRVHENVRVWPLEPELKFRVSMVHADSAPLSLVARSFMDALGRHIAAFLD